ncbi:MAG: hypothetical protein JO305_01625 [Alphaproteobacteria bacterium]|nr:hypothetical protein [Alphaproteobacteria bacterium]
MISKTAALAAALLLGSAALSLAQTTAPTATTTGDPNTTPTLSPAAPAAQNPGVNPNAAGTQLGSGQNGPDTRPGYGSSGNGSRPAEPNAVTGDQPLLPGANSFTADQARRRMEDNGYTQISELHQDQNSIWQAQAMKQGRAVRVGLDFRGHVAEEQ